MKPDRRANQQLRAVIDAAGLSYEAVARGVRRVAAENGEVLRTNKSAVAHWVAGTVPSGRASAYLSEALSRRLHRPVTLAEIGLPVARDVTAGHDLDPVEVLEDLGTRDPIRQHALATASFTIAGLHAPLTGDFDHVSRMRRFKERPARAGHAEAQVVRHITAAFASADERLGGAHGLSTLSTYLSDTAAPMLRGTFADEDARRDVFGAVAELAYLAGFKHHDLGHEGAAQRCYQTGYQLACQTGSPAHPAWMMRALAQQALSVGHARDSLNLIEAALTRADAALDPATDALLRITHARALAATGAREASTKALAGAEAALHRPGPPQPSFSHVSGPILGTAASHMARTLTVLGNHRAAEHRHRAALTLWDPVLYKRVHLLTYADLGDTLAEQVRADEALAAWSAAADLSATVVSGRTRTALTSIRSQLATYRRRNVPGAELLDQRIRQCLA